MVRHFNIEPNVIFTGHVPDEDLVKFYNTGDIFILPSLSEGFPHVILEAMASGLPIIATDVNGIGEIVEDGKNGLSR